MGRPNESIFQYLERAYCPPKVQLHVPDTIPRGISYADLDSTGAEIRLLRLKPERSEYGLLDFTMFTVSLNDKPSYNALSYVWGDPNSTAPIIVDGRVFHATDNLVRALDTIPLDLLLGNELWIDAICINQSDNEEKSSQVHRMAEIFRKATGVLAWLGEEADGSALVMKLIEYLAADVKACELLDFSWLTDPKYQDIVGHLAQYVDPLQHFLVHRPYWKRVWTLQEMVLAKECLLCCGRDTLDLCHIKTLLRYIRKCKELVRIVAPAPGVDRRVWHVASTFWRTSVIENILPSVLFNGERDEGYQLVSEALCLASRREAQDPRDKIYGILGLFDVSITVDYSVPVDQFYKESTAFFLQDIDETDNFFEYARATRLASPKQLPSWAVDWEVGIPLNTFTNRYIFWAPHPDLPLEQPVQIFGDVAQTAGMSVDRVTKVLQGNMASMSSRLASCFEFYFQDTLDVICRGILEQPPTSCLYVSGIPMALAVMSTIFGDVNFLDNKPIADLDGDHGSSDTLSAVVLDLLLDELQSRENLARACTYPEPTPDDRTARDVFYPRESDTECRWKSIADIVEMDHARPMLRDDKERLFSTVLNLFAEEAGEPAQWQPIHTAEGRIGYARCAVQEGDIICVLSCLGSPVVLRKVGDQYNLVSLCFVQGIMYGELGGDKYKDKFEIEEFEII